VLHATRILGQSAFQPEQLTTMLNLEYPQNSLLLDVAAISSRTFPEQFQYEFRLSDASGKAIAQRISGESQFIMEKLRPGRYRVSARAFSNDLVASEPLSFEFNVEKAPFPWASAALSVLLSVSLIALWYGYKQNRELANTRRQLANETESERRRIARDLHDQTLSDLRRLLLLTDQLPQNSDVAPTVFRSEIESISTEIRHICEDLSPSVLANVGLPAALEWALSEAVAHLPADRKLEYEFRSDEDLEERLRLDGAMQIQIYRILQEAISNVCRHAQAKRIALSIELRENDVLFTLEDDGRGFDWTKKREETGRGLTNIRSRTSLIEAEVQWLPRPGGGSTFTLRTAR
jgi:signal transduction histidine kinase